ncbi:MAG: hypothetical protein WCH31_03265 [Actinomycetes bacterium]
MLRSPILRGVVWSVLLVVVAVVTGVLGYRWPVIAGAEFVAWVAVVGLDRIVSRSGSSAARTLSISTRTDALVLPDDSSVRVLGPVGSVPAQEVAPGLVWPETPPLRLAAEPFEPVSEREPAPLPEPIRRPEPEKLVLPQLTLKPPSPRVREVWPPSQAQGAVGGPVQWNLWNLDRVVRERAVGDEEISYLLVYLRDYAGPDGLLPVEFDGLIRESFAGILAPASV